jgi:alkyldihydroxyacetonephosphate synthase
MESFSHSGKKMLYKEVQFDINYSRKNLRWDGWGAHGQDFFLKDHISEIIQLIKKEWSLTILPETPGIPIEDIKLRSTRLTSDIQKNLIKIVGEDNFKTDNYERIFHSLGKSYYDVLRLRFNMVPEFSDGIIYPKTESEIIEIINFCKSKNIAVIPFGGGSSVVGGVEAFKYKTQKAILTLDMINMNKLIDIDSLSNTATFQTGIYGPDLEKILNEKGYTLGHFPQSFEYSTLGGWIAAKGSGQQSGKYGKIERLTVSMKLITTEGNIITAKLPPSSMGPDLNSIFTGSEGIFGIISEATMKIQKLPDSRKYFAILFPSFADGVGFIKDIHARNIKFSMARLSDEEETTLFSQLNDLGKTNSLSRKFKKYLTRKVLTWNHIGERRCAMIAGIDGKISDIENSLDNIKSTLGLHNGFYAGTSPGKNWIKSRFNMPFLRNHFMERGIGVDTLETSITYDRILKLHDEVTVAIRKVQPVSNTLCHISHSYPEGASLYFTIIFPIDVKNPIEQWHQIKKAASDTILENGGSISHHHGIGMDHKEWYHKIIGEKAKKGLLQLKKSWDPKGIFNPGKLLSE